MGLELPTEIQSMIAHCEANVKRFTNEEMSVALHFAVTMAKQVQRLRRLEAHWRTMSQHFMPDDIRGPMMLDAANELRAIITGELA